MDHLLMPMKPARRRTEVPYLCKQEYRGPFQSFPVRQGWVENTHKVWKHEKHGQNADEFKAFLQSWLFFGIVDEVFGDLTKPGDWICKLGDGREVLSTRCLRQLLADLQKGQERLSNDPRQSRRRHVDACLETAISVINSLSLQYSPLAESNVILAIAFLCDLIEKDLGTEFDAIRASGSLHLGVSRPLQVSMLRDGWCKNDVHRLAHQLDLSSLYLASNLNMPEPQVDHKNCTTRLCIKSQIDQKKYVTNHDTNSCRGDCAYVGVERDKLTSILLSGLVPLIRYNAESDPYKIELVPATLGISYVAISHVWSHGLGNPRDNSLPRCQLNRISELVNNLCGQSEFGPNLFWLDTICFPVHSPEAADRAIIFMRKTYADADQVLVIDRYLEAVEQKLLLRTECLVRILCSSWTRRLWTLQEGALAKRLYFQFADEAIELEKAASLMTAEMTFLTSDRPLEFLPVSSMVSEIWEVWRTAASELPRIVLNCLSGGLRWRATSRASDEALCLATLAGLDMGELMSAEPEDRMRKFWSLLPNISAQTIFWSGPRIDHKGFRWAPATFLGQSEAIFQDFKNKSFSEVHDNASTTRTDSGLIFRCAGILLNTWSANIGRTFLMRDEKKRWYGLRRQGTAVLTPPTDQEEKEGRSLALVMKNTLDQSFCRSSPEKSITCVIASIYDVDEEKDIVYASTEDIAFLVPQGDTVSISIKYPLLVRLVRDCERHLGLESGNSLPTTSSPGLAVAEEEYHLVEQPSQPTARELEQRQSTSHTSKQVDTETDSSAIAMEAITLSEDEDLRPTRVKARFEDGRLSIDMHGNHYLLDGVELSEDQQWCLD